MKINKGFGLVELLIVMAIIGLMVSVAAFSWLRYSDNTNMKNAAREIASDFQNCKAKSLSESRSYQISFITGTTGSYTVSSAANATHGAVSTTKLASSFGNGIGIVFDAGCNGYGAAPTNVIVFDARGTCRMGCVKVTNSRGSSANITTNITGKAYVTFAMQ